MIRREPCPYERIHSRIEGIKAITVLANVAIENKAVTDQVWFPLWYFISETMNDIQTDADLLRRGAK